MSANPVPNPVLNLETEKTPTQATVRCSGRLVSDTCDHFQSTVRGLIPTTKLIVLDFTGVNYLDSSALGAIVGLYVSGKRAGCKLQIVNLTPRVREVFSMTRLFDVLETHSDKDMVGYTPQ